MLTKNLSTLKINRLTQEQYDREKASGTLDDTALYFTPEEEIIVPTSLSQLSDDETHRLVTDTEKTAWNAKADVFTITLSDGESGSLTTNKTYDEILEAYNSGKLLRITAEGGMLEGTFLGYAYNTFIFVFIVNSTGISITSDKVEIIEPFPSFLPSASTSDAGKILMVNDSGDAAWTKAPSSGAEVFLVTITPSPGSTLQSMSFTADKTYTEIVAAHEAGKIVLCSFSGLYFGQLTSVRGNYVVFGVDYLATSSSSSAKYVFTIYTDDSIAFNSLYFYAPMFVQKVISADAWSDGIYSFESDFDNMFYDIEVELDSTATSEQLDAWSKAKLTAVFGTNTMKALGDVPTIDIPVIVKVLANDKVGKEEK